MNRSVFGRWPIATNSPVTASVDCSPATVLVSPMPVTVSSPKISVTREFQRNSIFGLAIARSCMIFEARSSSRRWIIVTLSANLVRNVASSMAESPPPTTAISWPRKKKPSQVAHVDSPWPIRRSSASRPSISDWAPVLTMTALAGYSVSRTQTRKGRSLKSTLVTFSVMISVPNRSACSRIPCISSGPMMPSGNPGKFSTSVVSISWPPGWSLVLDGSPSMSSGARLARAV